MFTGIYWFLIGLFCNIYGKGLQESQRSPILLKRKDYYVVGKPCNMHINIMGIACIPAIPVILKSPHSDFHVKIVGILTLQRDYGDTPYQM